MQDLEWKPPSENQTKIVVQGNNILYNKFFKSSMRFY